MKIDVKKIASILPLGLLTLTAACAGVLGLRSPERRPFEHRAHVLKGIHCDACHLGVALAGEDGPLHLPRTEGCVSCHKAPHDDHPCGGCHGLSSTRQAAIAARSALRFEHRTHAPRVKGDCVRCHVDIAQGDVALRPRMAVCGGCHEHQAELTAADRCDRCHVNLREEGVTPEDHLVHGAGFLREHGVRAAASRELCSSCHAERFCVGCHAAKAPALPERLGFDDPMRAGVHRAGFQARHAEEARGDPGLCTTCHAPSSCSACHARAKVAAGTGARSPHPSGWLGLMGQRNDHGLAALRDPEECAGCHDGAGEMLCVGCHKVGGVGGNPHGPGFQSRKQPKTDRPCRLCHTLGGP